VVSGIVLAGLIEMLAAGQSTPDLKARCDQLLDYYDWYGASRSENTDGSRNMVDIDARLECQAGRYEKGIAAMEDLLRRKRLPVPAINARPPP
jgi:hypothetical protein